MLFSRGDCSGPNLKPPAEGKIQALVNCPDRIATLRKRLSSLSWFIGRLNEYIARAANREDDVTGRFWESRYKCQALLDESAIAACMVYVDLNLIRAGLARSPEESHCTSIQERIRVWKKVSLQNHIIDDSIPQNGMWETLAGAFEISASGSQTAKSSEQRESSKDSSCVGAIPDFWLCPIQIDSVNTGVLRMSETQYFDLVDKSGRIIRHNKSGAISSDLKPILKRISVNPEAWVDTISNFGSKFHLAAGLLSSLREFADNVGRKWLKGLTSANAAFI